MSIYICCDRLHKGKGPGVIRKTNRNRDNYYRFGGWVVRRASLEDGKEPEGKYSRDKAGM